VLRIDASTGLVTGCNRETVALLDVDVTGRAWQEVLQAPAPIPGLLADALPARVPVALPPLALAFGDGREVAVAIRHWPQQDCAWLLLEEIAPAGPDNPLPDVAPGDTLAVLGLGGMALDAEGGLAGLAVLMQEIRLGLAQILRQQDWAGMPAGTAITLVLKETGIDPAADIGRALLSHLQPLMVGRRGASVHLGMAEISQTRSPLAGLVAANQAMLVARSTAAPVLVAGERDLHFLAAQAIGSSGAFSPPLGEVSFESPASERTGKLQAPPVSALETGIDGYVDDNMEGAIDQAVFLANVDLPVAIIGPRGTGKLYIARVIHLEAGGAPDALVSIDCREFRGRQTALRHIASALDGEPGRTLVFKSPQLLHPEVQRKLARQLGSRVLADTDPPRYLPEGHYVGLFPDELDRMVRRGELDETLAGVFSGYPIRVPPLKDRGRAVLRWAHKILGQESSSRDRPVQGFTADAELALLQHDWPGNISELRQAISDAMDHTDKEWLTPVDLGLFATATPGARPASSPSHKPFLEAVDDALAASVNGLIEFDTLKPLGQWLDDEVVLAVLKRYRGDRRKAAGFLQTRTRNLGRWMPGIEAREDERGASRLWQEPRRLVQQWIGESPPMSASPQRVAQDMLLVRVKRQCMGMKVAARAKIMGVSTPTYHKRLQELEQDGTHQEAAEHGTTE
jgi:transcriptional regulator with AAA-type ATPase domain